MPKTKLLFAALFTLVGCAVDDTGNPEPRSDETIDACTYVCTPCPPDQICTQVCYPGEFCTPSCPWQMLCAPGFHFSDTLCTCIPDDKGIPCGPNMCELDQVCCNASCGICVDIGEEMSCTQQACPITEWVEECGPSMCPPGMECCNASCGICTFPGQGCTRQQCNIPDVPEVEECGRTLCPPGTECCNASCGTCVLPGMVCGQQACPDPLDPIEGSITG